MSDSRFLEFKFRVHIGTGGADGPHAGFQECSVEKITSLNKATDITMKRGLIDSGDFYDWLKQVREGDPAGRRRVRIELVDEDHSHVVRAWRLRGARIKKYVAPLLNAKGGGDVEIEELTLDGERLELDWPPA